MVSLATIIAEIKVVPLFQRSYALGEMLFLPPIIRVQEGNIVRGRINLT
jgi:hypothetical protein